MKVFISHSFKDEDQALAQKLKEVLSTKGMEGYLAEKEKKYTLLISEKVQKRIKESDHLVAIITKNAMASASVNQELGYALREGIKPIIMLEKEVKEMGVLTYGRDPEEFSRESFDKSCVNIRDFLIGEGPRIKTNDKDLEHLKQTVYTPIFNKIDNIFNNPVNRRKSPEDFLSNLSALDKLKLELDVKKILEEYTKARNEWARLFHTLNFDYENQKSQLIPIITKVFAKENMLDETGSIILTSDQTMAPKDWIQAFSWVIVETRIKNGEELYDRLVDYSIETGIGHEKWLKKFNNGHPNLFQNIFDALPELRKNFTTEFLNEDWEKIKEKTFGLLRDLQEKLKNKLV